MTIDDLRTRATITVPELAALLDVGINQMYAAVRDGLVPSIRVGRAIRIPTPKVLELLGAPQYPTHSDGSGATPEPIATADPHGGNREQSPSGCGTVPLLRNVS